MKHVSLDELRSKAEILPLEALPSTGGTEQEPAILSRKERLERWATVLEAHDKRVRPFYGLEHMPRRERREARADDTPLAVAFADPVLRARGLSGDTVGEVMNFFELTDRQMHAMFCDCHFQGTMTTSGVAGRLRAIAARKPLSERLSGLWRRAFG